MTTSHLDHPFLDGRKYRADDIGEVASTRNWWRAMAFVLAGGMTLSLSGNVYQGIQRKEVPYFIEWNSASGDMRPLAMAPHAPESEVTVRFWLREFVQTLRAVSTDQEVMRERWNRAMFRLTKEGKVRFVEYAAQMKPLQQTEEVKVEIKHMLKQSAQTWDVRWEETRQTGEDRLKPQKETYRGLFMLRQRAPLADNPAGIFWHEWSFQHE